MDAQTDDQTAEYGLRAQRQYPSNKQQKNKQKQ